jgi:hypothetical protein
VSSGQRAAGSGRRAADTS